MKHAWRCALLARQVPRVQDVRPVEKTCTKSLPADKNAQPAQKDSPQREPPAAMNSSTVSRFACRAAQLSPPALAVSNALRTPTRTTRADRAVKHALKDTQPSELSELHPSMTASRSVLLVRLPPVLMRDLAPPAMETSLTPLPAVLCAPPTPTSQLKAEMLAKPAQQEPPLWERLA